MRRLSVLPALLIAATAALAVRPLHAAAPVQRCVDADGRAIYTDRRCDALGAIARLPPPAGNGNSLDGGPRLYRGGCPRTLSALVGEIGAAVQSGDVNRLSSVYDWTGTSDAGARRILDRLEAVVARPLLDIAPVMPADPVDAGIAAAPAMPAMPATGALDTAIAEASPTPASWQSRWIASASSADAPTEAPLAGTGTGAAFASTSRPPRPRPVALRLEQTLAGTATPSRTVFGLRRSFGCFWVSL